MAKIKNTLAYPIVTPQEDDLIILTDVSDYNETKTSKIKSFKDQSLNITLTPEQMLNSYSSPVLLIPKPGIGRYIVPFGEIVVRNHADAAIPTGYYFGSPSDHPVIKVSSTIYAYIPFTIFTPANPYTGWADVYATSTNELQSNAPLFFRAQNENPTLGNSHVTISMQYRIVEI